MTAAARRLLIVDDFKVPEIKTKAVIDRLNALGANNVLIVAAVPDDALFLSARNIPYVEVSDSADVDPVSLIRHEKVVMTVGAVKQIEERLS